MGGSDGMAGERRRAGGPGRAPHARRPLGALRPSFEPLRPSCEPLFCGERFPSVGEHRRRPRAPASQVFRGGVAALFFSFCASFGLAPISALKGGRVRDPQRMAAASSVPWCGKRRGVSSGKLFARSIWVVALERPKLRSKGR